MKTRAPRIALTLGLALALFSACGSEPEASASRGEGADHDAEMARDAEAARQENLAYAEGKEPVLTLEELSGRLGADSATRARLAPRVEALNAALVRLAELHREHDAGVAADSSRETSQ